MKKGITVLIVVVIVIASFAAGFAVSNYESQKVPSQGGSKNSSVSYITVIDDENNVVKVPQPVKRIVSLAPSCTEVAFSLGLGKSVVGDTIYD
ncbi:MAG: hypothetical protein ACP5R3_06785, partial [Thermoplasmata archaeon]